MSKNFAIVFPGQGSQAIGMLAELAAQFPIVAETFAQASDNLNYNLWDLIQQGPAELLNQTIHTQPALLAAGVAVWRVWQQQTQARPKFMAGHSLGEYTALVCANALDFGSAIKLVAERGRLMQEAVPEGKGAMAAIVGLTEIQIQELCEVASESQIVAPANYNAIGQIVIAGESAAIDRAITLAQQAGAKIAKRLPMSVPSHSSLMHPAAEKLAVYLDKIIFKAPEIAVINNVDVSMMTNADEIKSALVRQLYSPVRWVETIQTMAKQGVECMIECGPGKVLTGLNKRIDANIATVCIQDPVSLEQALTQLS